MALGVPLAAVCAQAGSPALALVYNLLLLGVAWITGRMGPRGDQLHLERRFDPVLSVRVPNRIELRLRNDGAETLAGVLRDESPDGFASSDREFAIGLGAGDSKTLSYTVTPNERGSTSFRGTFLRLRRPLGLVDVVVELPNTESVRVYPNVLALREFDLLRQRGMLRQMGIRRSRMRGLGTEFESLREYAEGDDFRKIDWKATARRGRLVVRNFEHERNQAVIVCIDIGRRMLAEVDGVRKLDHVLDALLMLAHAAARSGDAVGILVYADHVRRYVPPQKGRGALSVIIEAIHDLIAEPVESDPIAAFSYLSARWKRRSLLVCFTDVEDEEQAHALSAAMGPLTGRHLTLVARVADPRLGALVATPLEQPRDLFTRAAAQQLDSERRLAGSMLSVRGTHTLDAEPADLAAALVSYYFDVKQRGAL